LDVLVEIAGGALQSLPSLLGNMTAVLVAALLSVLAVSFFRGEVTVFTKAAQVALFALGTINPILGLAGGIAIVLRSHRNQEWAQRELGTLFCLLFFAESFYFGLVQIPQFTVVS
jgi:hypothetical protein